MHNIEHQITFPGSNFIFHDSCGFESGATKEMEDVWEFIEERANTSQMMDQLHAIWYVFLCWSFTRLPNRTFHRYCIPMDSTRPLLPAELQFFERGTGSESYNCSRALLVLSFSYNLSKIVAC